MGIALSGQPIWGCWGRCEGQALVSVMILLVVDGHHICRVHHRLNRALTVVRWNTRCGNERDGNSVVAPKGHSVMKDTGAAMANERW